MNDTLPTKKSARQLFRPCIDLHEGKVKQLVGSTLQGVDQNSPVTTSSPETKAQSQDSMAPTPAQSLQTNFTATEPPSHYAQVFKSHHLIGGHVILLKSSTPKTAKTSKPSLTEAPSPNVLAAKSILETYPDALHIGGGIGLENGKQWLDRGARKLIFTSALFENRMFSFEKIKALERAFGKKRIVIDLSSMRLSTPDIPLTRRYQIRLQGWSQPSDLFLTAETLRELSRYASEFLVHSIALEGKKQGIDTELIRFLADISPLRTVYAGGVRSVADIEAIKTFGRGKIDFTVGSALDLYGGTLPLQSVLEHSQISR